MVLNITTLVDGIYVHSDCSFACEIPFCCFSFFFFYILIEFVEHIYFVQCVNHFPAHLKFSIRMEWSEMNLKLIFFSSSFKFIFRYVSPMYYVRRMCVSFTWFTRRMLSYACTHKICLFYVLRIVYGVSVRVCGFVFDRMKICGKWSKKYNFWQTLRKNPSVLRTTLMITTHKYIG